jgi:hypothetical protein
VSAAQAIPLLRFFGGAQPLGLVAAAVERLESGAADCPHVAALLGLPKGADPNEQRTVTLSAYGKRARILIDGPVQLRSVAAHDLLPAARLLRRGRIQGVLGFTREAEHTVLLLDVAWLVEKAW